MIAIATFVLAMTSAAAFAQNEAMDPATKVDIRIQSFGVGGASRQGSWTGVRVQLQSFETEPRPVLVSWELTDPDGDIEEVTGRTVVNPGGTDYVWLYARLPFDASPNSRWIFNVYALDADGNRLNEVLGSLPYQPPMVAFPSASFIGIVGIRDGGLSGYSQRIGSTGDTPLTTHDKIEILAGLNTVDLPTRWMGLQQFESIVWIEPDPLALSLEKAEAIQEWVYRGGHLVIILPDLAQRWQNTLLDPILPEVRIFTFEDQEVRSAMSAGGVLQYLMRGNSTSDAPPYSIEPQPREPAYPIITLHAFGPASPDGWKGTDTLPLMPVNAVMKQQIDALTATVPDYPHGAIHGFAAQRFYGLGQVTMVGVPVTNPLLNRPGLELPEAEVFWNYILGRRNDTPNRAELGLISQDERAGRLTVTNRNEQRVGRSIPSQIELRSQGSTGILLALVLFALYWVISGPLAFGFLKNKGWERHSWLAFALIGVLFTLVGWTGAKMLRSKGIKPRHFTVVDHVFGMDWERSYTLITAALEGYGSQRVHVGPEDDARIPWHNAVSPFYDPTGSRNPFPDPRRYVVNSSDPDTIAFPARSTAREMVIESLHGPSSTWGMPTYTGEANRPRMIQQMTRSVGGEQVEQVRLQGQLSHSLPSPLRDTTIIFVSPEEWNLFGRRPEKQTAGMPRLKVYSWSLAGGQWKPGEVIDLGAAQFLPSDDRFFWRFSGVNSTVERLMSEYRQSTIPGGRRALGSTTSDLTDDVLLLSFFRYMDPPQWVDPSVRESPRLLRTLGREFDLSSWLNRPCLIIFGHVTNTDEQLPLPEPVQIGGSAVDQTATNSHVFIRWIYPFKEIEPGN